MNVTYKIINGSEWQWAEDYIYAVATYIIFCPQIDVVKLVWGFRHLVSHVEKRFVFRCERDYGYWFRALHFRR